MLVVLGAVALGCAQSQTSETELSAACFAGMDVEAWDEKFPIDEWCATEVDRGADGDIDARGEQQFDSDGNLIWRLEETGEEATLEYDELGRATLIERVDADGVLLWRERREYDGRSSRIDIDSDGNTEIDVVKQNDYGCFPEEDEWPFPGPCTTSVDSDADGLVDGVTHFEYEDGELSTSLLTSPDSEPRRTRYFYDDEGGIVRIEHDDGANGTIDNLYEVQRIDAHTTRTWQGDPAGERESWTETVTDDQGRLISESKFGQGELIARNEAVWSRDGRSLRVTSMHPDDPEQDTITEGRYDAAGNFLGVAIDMHPLGSPDECYYVSYACWEER